MIGPKFGPYEVLAKLGEGGMGQVYRARDTRLKREVAVKVLPAEFAHDPERLARFQREAELLASLNHPHIAAIYGLEQTPDATALVLELIEGETLAELIERGPVPVAEALRIAAQIAEALEAAHEQGVIHRDLKPANIKITPAGVVKVLDFGLAKAMDVAAREASPARALSLSPTLTSPAMMTGVGMILGTAAYMAPEQAKGRPADKRSDVWAFGCVLYELLTGHRPFAGDDVTDTLASVLRSDPEWRALPESTPTPIRRLVRQCLEKDRNKRAPDIAIARFAIQDALDSAGDAPAIARKERSRWALPVGVALVVAAASALTGLAVWQLTRPAPPKIVRFDVTPPSEAPFNVGPNGINLAISADGTRVLYHARRGGTYTLDLRRLDTGDTQSLAGTDQALNPALSPDGNSIVFTKAGKLQRLTLDSRSLVALCDAVNISGVSWPTADTILFARSGSDGGLFRVAATGGIPERLAAPDVKAGEQDYSYPAGLPDGRAVAFVARVTSGETSRLRISVRSLMTGEQKVLVEDAGAPRYASTGHIMYVQGAALMAAPFDAGRLELTGSAVPVINTMVTKAAGAVANYDVSGDGTLVYVSGSTVTYISRFVWRNRAGQALGAAIGDLLDFPRYPRISPDGRRLAATIGAANEGSIWVYDLSGAAQPLKLTFQAHNVFPVWSPDGSQLLFGTTREGPLRSLFSVRADGSIIEPVKVVVDDKDKNFSVWSPDGRAIVFRAGGGPTQGDLWVKWTDGDRVAEPWLQTAFEESEPNFSPDGRWLAYVADQTGQPEVWVRPFPGPGSPARVSPSGGHDPVWSKDGRELFYQEGEKLMTAAVAAREPAIQFRAPRMLFEGGFIAWEPNAPRTFDVSRDGRFLMIDQTPTYSQRFHVVVNWVEELKRLVPAD